MNRPNLANSASILREIQSRVPASASNEQVGAVLIDALLEAGINASQLPLDTVKSLLVDAIRHSRGTPQSARDCLAA